MATKKQAKAQEDSPVPKVIKDVQVEVHLDRDPNDPRKVPEAGKLPSLDD